MKVTIKTAHGGALILEGDKLRNPETGDRYACAATGTYSDGAEVPVRAHHDAFDLRGGEALEWEDPRPGCAHVAVATKPVTRADFDRLEKKVDDLTARFEKLLADNASRLVTDEHPGVREIHVKLDGPSAEWLSRMQAVAADLRALKPS